MPTREPILSAHLAPAGFRYVVGTLWELLDRHCVDVARVVYETMRDEAMTDMAVCRGLHRVVGALRDNRVESKLTPRTAEVVSVTAPRIGLPNSYWVSYVHFGA